MCPWFPAQFNFNRHKRHNAQERPQPQSTISTIYKVKKHQKLLKIPGIRKFVECGMHFEWQYFPNFPRFSSVFSESRDFKSISMLQQKGCPPHGTSIPLFVEMSSRSCDFLQFSLFTFCTKEHIFQCTLCIFAIFLCCSVY